MCSTVDSLMVLSFLYGGAKDEAGKTSVSMSIAITRDGKTVGKLDDQKFETPASPTIGPIPLTSYAPGKYTVTVKVKDNVAKKDVSDVVTFEVAGAPPAVPTISGRDTGTGRADPLRQSPERIRPR